MLKEGLALSARDVRMEYRDPTTRDRLVAIERMDLDIRQGEFAAIVGPSGCGKSTFLKIVNGLLPASEGEIEVRRPDHGKDHAMVFQDSSLFPWYSVLRNVSYGLVCQGVSRKEAQARAMPLIKLVGLEGFETKYPYQLSGGMQQRANLCRALVHEPQLLMLDEPFAALDTFTREELWSVMQALWLTRKFTAILVTHELREAVFLADCVHVMSSRPGRIVLTRRIDLPRPRTLAMTFESRFVELVHELRDAISAGQTA